MLVVEEAAEQAMIRDSSPLVAQRSACAETRILLSTDRDARKVPVISVPPASLIYTRVSRWAPDARRAPSILYSFSSRKEICYFFMHKTALNDHALQAGLRPSHNTPNPRRILDLGIYLPGSPFPSLLC